jgi:hypothetical protein
MLKTGQAAKRGGSWNNNPFAQRCEAMELPFRVSQQQQPRQPQQQYRFSVSLRGPSTLLCQSWQVGIC